MAYIKLMDCEHGELGHNGWAYVLNNPFDDRDSEHPVNMVELGQLVILMPLGYDDERDPLDVENCDPRVEFRRIFAGPRDGIAPRQKIVVPVTVAQARAARANRAAYDAMHMPPDGWRVITD